MASGTWPSKSMPSFLRFVGDGEVGVARDAGLDLDEVDAAALEHVDGFRPSSGVAIAIAAL